MIQRRSFLAGIAALPLARATATASGPTISPEGLGWTVNTPPRETAAIINKALAIARESGATYIDNAPRRIAGTIRLGGKMVMEFGVRHQWRAETSDLATFDAIVGTTKRLFVDNAGARGTIIRGPLKLLGTVPKAMTLAGRRAIPADLVAYSASRRAPADEIIMESLTIEGFGHAFYQGKRTDAGLVLPYTRLNCRTAIIRFCIAPLVFQGANGLDDAVFTVLRLSRNAGRSLLRGTDLNATSLFNFGLDPKKDAGPGMAKLVKRSRSVVAPGLVAGMVIAVPGFASRVVRVDGEKGILEDDALADYTGPFVVNPPTFNLHNSSLSTLHAYVEGFHRYPIALGRNATLSCRDFKISRGIFSAWGGYAVAILGSGTSLDVHLNPRSVMNPHVRAVVGRRGNAPAPQGRVLSAEPR